MTVDEYEFRTRLIAVEIETCKQLASNDVKTRRKGLRRLRALLSGDQNVGVEFEDFNRIWTGLFTYVWMSDTPLVQEADVDEISNLIHRIRIFDGAMLFVRGFFATITNQWNRISHHRTDKFLMFMRRFLRQALFFLKNSDWESEKLVKFSSELYSAIQILPLELIQHLSDIYNEELAKVTEGNISTDALILLLKCFVDCITQQKPSKAIVNHINTNIFCSLVGQVKLLIKQKAAVEFDPEAFSLDEPDEAGELVSNLDPRPGNAHVFLPYIDFDENKVIEFLEPILLSSEVGQKAKNIISQNIQMLKSVTRLRQSMKQSTNILREVNDKEEKRMKKPEKFSSLVKKACKKLETEDGDFPSKKMKKLLRSNQWEISRNVDSNPKVESTQGWTVTDLRKKGPVSFSEKPDFISYEDKSNRSSEASPVSIIVPRSACDHRPGILLSEQNYTIVDFNKLGNQSKNAKTDILSSVEMNEDVPTEPIWITTQFDISNSQKTHKNAERVKPSECQESASLEIPQENEETEFEESISKKTPKNSENMKKKIRESAKATRRSEVRKRSTRGKSIEDSEMNEEVEQSDESDLVEVKMNKNVKSTGNENVKLTRRRKTDSDETVKTNEKVKLSEQTEVKKLSKRRNTVSIENLDEEETMKKPKKSIIGTLSNYEPRKTRSGRVYNV